jgi:hypothetical protein
MGEICYKMTAWRWRKKGELRWIIGNYLNCEVRRQMKVAENRA